MGFQALQRRLDATTTSSPGAADPMLRLAWVAPVGCLAVLCALAAVLAPFPSVFRVVMWSEQGLVENLTVALAVGGAILALRLACSPDQAWAMRLWHAMFFLMLAFLAGEETSWGQQWFGWATPEDFAAINQQGETNLHNLGHDWIEDVPKTLVILAMTVCGLIVPLFIGFSGRRLAVPAWLRALWPSAALWPVAAVYTAARVVERVIAATYEVSSWGLYFRTLREGLEVFMVLYLTLYLWDRWVRLRQAQAVSAADDATAAMAFPRRRL